MVKYIDRHVYFQIINGEFKIIMTANNHILTFSTDRNTEKLEIGIILEDR